MQRAFSITLIFLFNSCAFFRLDSNSVSQKVNFKMKSYEYTELENGKVNKSATYVDYRKKLVKEYLEEDVFSKMGKEIDVKVSIDENNEDTKKHKLKLRDKDGWEDLTLTEAWFKTSMYSATIIPFWNRARYTAHVEASHNGKLLCKKSCDGGYFYIQWLPFVFVAPLSFYYNEKKFQKNLAGYCLEQCLSN